MSALLLLSGGIDSALCLAGIRDIKLCLGIDYGQSHIIELNSARCIAADAGVEYLEVKIPSLHKIDGEIFAGRNLVMIAIAASIAQSRGLDQIVIGCNKSDWEMFPDCRYSFISAASAAVAAYGCSVLAPLLTNTKAEILTMSRRLGVKKETTWTCYSPHNGAQCGRCHACMVMAEANV